MNEIWAKRLAAGTQVWDDCPATRKVPVMLILGQWVEEGKNGMTAERYLEITGEEYEA